MCASGMNVQSYATVMTKCFGGGVGACAKGSGEVTDGVTTTISGVV